MRVRITAIPPRSVPSTELLGTGVLPSVAGRDVPLFKKTIEAHCQAGWDSSNRFLNELPDPEKFPDSRVAIVISAQRFELISRLCRGRWTWYVDQGALPDLLQAAGFTPRTMNEVAIRRQVQRLRTSELPISMTRFPQYLSPSTKVVIAIRTQLPKPIDELPDCASFVINEMSFTAVRRRSLNQIVWAISKADLSRLAEAAGVRLVGSEERRRRKRTAPVGNDTVPLSGYGIGRRFVGNPYELLAALREKVVITKRHAFIRLPGTDIPLERRKHNRHIVLTFPATRAAEVARAMKWSLRTAPLAEWGKKLTEPTELPLSERGLRQAYYGDVQRGLMPSLKPFLPPIDLGKPARRLRVVIHGEKFTLYPRRAGNKTPVWALQHAEIPRLAQAMGWRLRDKMTEMPHKTGGEQPITVSGVKRIFCVSDTHLKKLMKGVPGLAQPPTEAGSLDIQVGSFRCTAVARLGHKKGEWTLPQKEFLELGKAWGLALRQLRPVDVEVLRPDEEILSSHKLKDHYGVGHRSPWTFFKAAALPDPALDRKRTMTLQIGDDSYEIRKRRNDKQLCWTMSGHAFRRAAGRMGWDISGSNGSQKRTRVSDLLQLVEE